MNGLPFSAALSGPSDPDWMRVAQDLLSALHQEYHALSANDVDALETAVRSKQELVARLGGMDSRLFAAAGTDVKSVIEQCRRLNEKNGAIVAARMYLTQRSLAILRGETETGLYGPAGGAPGSAGGRSIARA